MNRILLSFFTWALMATALSGQVMIPTYDTSKGSGIYECAAKLQANAIAGKKTGIFGGRLKNELGWDMTNAPVRWKVHVKALLEFEECRDDAVSINELYNRSWTEKDTIAYAKAWGLASYLQTDHQADLSTYVAVDSISVTEDLNALKQILQPLEPSTLVNVTHFGYGDNKYRYRLDYWKFNPLSWLNFRRDENKLLSFEITMNDDLSIVSIDNYENLLSTMDSTSASEEMPTEEKPESTAGPIPDVLLVDQYGDMLIVYKSKFYGLMNLGHELVLPVKYRKMEQLNSGFTEGEEDYLRILSKDVKWGVVHVESGEIIIPCENRAVYCRQSESGLQFIIDPIQGKRYNTDSNGKRIED